MKKWRVEVTSGLREVRHGRAVIAVEGLKVQRKHLTVFASVAEQKTSETELLETEL